MPGPANDLNISQAGYVVFDGVSQFTGRTLTAGTGITITNPNGTGGNSVISSTSATTDLHTARYIVAANLSGTGANYSTIAAAIAAAQGTGINSTIFIQPGTYTENLTLVSGVNLVSFMGEADGNVTIIGKLTLSSGTVDISNIKLQTNSDNIIACSAGTINLNNCYLNLTNNTGISQTGTGTVNLIGCTGNLGTTGIAIFVSTSSGSTVLNNCNILNSGSSTTASSSSAGLISLNYTRLNSVLSTSSTGSIGMNQSIMQCAAINTTAITANGTGTTTINNSNIASGTASALSVGAGNTITVSDTKINSSNVNTVTGLGVIQYNNLAQGTSPGAINAGTNTGLQENIGIAVLGTPLALTYGGTNASLTASNGGIFYSTASAGAILAGTATAGQALLSGSSSAPIWSTATYPAVSVASGNVLTDNGTNFVSSPIPSQFTPNSVVNLYDDFFSIATSTTTLTGQLTWTIASTGWMNSSASSTAAHPGVIGNQGPMTSGSRILSLGTGVGSATTGGGFVLGGGQITINWIFNIGTLSNSTNRYTLTFGIGDTVTTATVANGCWIQYSDNLNSGEWTFNTSKTSTPTNSNSSVVATAAWHNAQIVINAGASSVSFLMDGVSLGTAITSNIPADGVPFFSLIWAVGSIPQGTIQIDMFSLTQTLTTPR